MHRRITFRVNWIDDGVRKVQSQEHKEIILNTAQEVGMNKLSTERMMERLNTPEKMAKMVALIEQKPPKHEVTLYAMSREVALE